MKTITEIEKRREEAEKHGDLVQPGVMEAFYQGMAVAFEEAIGILKEEGAKIR